MTRLAGPVALGAGVTAAALALGSRPVLVAGLGLLLATAVARIWAGLARSSVAVSCAVEPVPAVEGDPVALLLDLRRSSRVPVGSVTFATTLGSVGQARARLPVHGLRGRGRVALGPLPRGKYELENAQVVLGDHLGLVSVSLPVELGTVLLVRPRAVELPRLFSDAGRLGGDGRRLLLRRPVGFDFHSVREYEHGESLRRVHWPTTARRGRLMVKELEDSPRDAVAVLLDCDPVGDVRSADAGSSFDVAVRAAASLLRASGTRGRKAVLLTTGREQGIARVRVVESDLGPALDLLAGVQADALDELAHALRHDPRTADAGELVVVTARVTAATADALLGAATRRLVSVVWIDAASFAGRPTRSDAGLLRIAAAGIPTAVVRAGDDLQVALAPRAEGAAAHG